MSQLAQYFQVNLNYIVFDSLAFKTPSNIIVFLAQPDKKHFLIISYLSKFPLMSSKHLNYLCFVKATEYLGKILTDQEISEIRLLKKSMNNNRTEYN